jgi:propanol-preferring alcohol dehydrogenase
MRAMRLHRAGEPLVLDTVPTPVPAPRQVLLKVRACGVCRTDLHVLDGELPDIAYPIVPGHEVVGRVVARGSEATRLPLGARVGVPWLGATCGRCRYCRGFGAENLCDAPGFTGYSLDGGYAEFLVADERYCLELPSRYSDEQAAPLLCAGLIGFRAYRAAGGGETLGLYGFGAAAHLLATTRFALDEANVALGRVGQCKALASLRRCSATSARSPAASSSSASSCLRASPSRHVLSRRTISSSASMASR